MTPEKRNTTSPLEIGREEEERLIAIWKLLKDFDESDYPAIRTGCGKARDEIRQVIFDLGLNVEED